MPRFPSAPSSLFEIRPRSRDIVRLGLMEGLGVRFICFRCFFYIFTIISLFLPPSPPPSTPPPPRLILGLQYASRVLVALRSHTVSSSSLRLRGCSCGAALYRIYHAVIKYSGNSHKMQWKLRFLSQIDQKRSLRSIFSRFSTSFHRADTFWVESLSPVSRSGNPP